MKPMKQAEVEITAMSSEGLGIAKQDGKVIFTAFGVPGDKVKVNIKRSKKNYSDATISELYEPSALRTTAPCPHFGVCGGCKWQHIQYPAQLKFKRDIVNDAFTKIGKVEFPEIPATVGCEQNYYYRNKLEFTFTDRRWISDEEVKAGTEFEHRNGLGFHVPGNFWGVIDVERCYLQADPSNNIRIAVRDYALANNIPFFNLHKQFGYLRNLLIRTTSTGELLVLLSVYEDRPEELKGIMEFILKEFPQVTSLQYVVNPKRNDTIYDLDIQVYHGRAYIIEQLGDYKFKIGPKSFFQTNSAQGKLLYDITKEYAALKPDDIVYDLYTGVGSIGIYVSDACKSVTGIEQIEDAIRDAKENATMNGITNCSFYAGDVRMVLNPEFIAANGKPSVVITDPPRAGMHEDVVNTLLELAAPRIVYVSCNPSTQARDLQLLDAKYKVVKVQPVDMFPNTTHIENVAVLELK